LRALAAAEVPYPLLAKEFGVSAVTVGQIVRRTTWEWVPAGKDEKKEGIALLLKRPHLMTERERMLLTKFAAYRIMNVSGDGARRGQEN